MLTYLRSSRKTLFLSRSRKPLFWLSVLFVVGLFSAGSVSGHAAVSATDVKVQVNDELVHFPDAQPFIDADHTTQVPVRMVMEQLGFQVDWQMVGQEVAVTLKSGEQTVSFITGENAEATVNGVKAAAPADAKFIDGRVYVPLRFVSEAFGYLVQWDAQNRIAIVAADGKYHAPAWYRPQEHAIVTAAKQYIGIPYVWGGTTPSGFDCSGFVQYLYRMNGVSLPRTSAMMYAHAGYHVSDLQPGDLVFFSEGGRITHVGIYMDNGEFISATTSKGVKIASLHSSYWGSRYVGAKRVI